MTSETSQDDPHPELPSAFSDRTRVAELAEMAKPENEPKSLEIQGLEDIPENRRSRQNNPHRPKVLVRTVLSSMADSATFGQQMKDEAIRRRFDEASRRAFVGDGLPWNWTIHQELFSDYVPVLDFIHVTSYLYAASLTIDATEKGSWALYLRLATACWCGDVEKVITELEKWLRERGINEPQTVEQDHPLRAVVDAWRYLGNNRGRMAYPTYRKAGLPTTSSLMESLVKQISSRVKGTEMFWDRPDGAERILQIRAAILSDDDRLERYLHQRPGWPYVRRTTLPRQTATAA
jgi:hypothetical protein